MAGLKLVDGGSTPPFLVNVLALGQTQAPQMCGKEEGSHAVIQRLLLLIPLLGLHVLRQMLLIE